MLNKVMLIGRLGKDPEMRLTADGTPVAQFSLATERTWRDELGQRQSETDWHNIVAWGRLGQIVKTYTAKGRLVYVEGRLQTRSWEDTNQVRHYRTEVVAEQVKFLERKAEVEAEPPSAMPEEELPL
jgi:single-strand DNA-binding protein